MTNPAPADARSVRRRVAVVVLAEVAAVTAVLLLKRFDGIDLEVYLGGARALVEHGTPYAAPVPTSYDIALPFLYPPLAALLFVPGTLLPFGVAITAFSVASILAVGVVAYLVTASLLGVLGDRSAVRGHTIAAAVAVGAQLACAVVEPVRSNLEFGQVNALLMVIVAADLLLPGRARTRGLLVGLAAAVKLVPLVFVAFFLFRRELAAAVRAVAAFVVAGAALWLVLPTASRTYWTETLFAAGRMGHDGEYIGNQSLRGVLARTDLAPSWQLLLWALGSAVVLALVVHTVRKADPVVAMLACAIGGLLVSPTSWNHHWVWALPVLVYLGWRWRAASWWPRALTVVAAAVYLLGPMWFADDLPGGVLGWPVAESYTLLGVALLGTLAGTPGRACRSTSEVVE
ncbi:alpha-1,2-mannosyltransferase [Prauserella shujinwangii]|uniref:Alpha-1,2-mannosyltransferase n=1 Tax=Prauserella shujinwangii TaxID=1453103 RepID=A0A2T0LQ39_9PSEU|nr:alpha-1,2-mannosyltransferase [Prauserella shujinwangii]